ncbi:MAG TPA: peroxide stress protein YaaA [Actinomycetales bacterium]|nr:peroxide stress protein YaaA [Actinomycetales bacterium]
MLVLLPPSEGKAPVAGRRRPVDLERLSWPELRAARTRVLDALAAVSARDDAVGVLGVGASVAGEVQRNTRLRQLAARPVRELYTGVLYDALDLATLPPAARRSAARSLVIVSALWGALRPGDAVPPYRLSMGTDLPGVGPLAAFWRKHLDGPLTEAAGSGVVVDCRSSTYQAAWTPPPEVASRTVAVRVLKQQAGRRNVVSHMAKQHRGLVARHLVARPGPALRSPRSVAAAVAEAFRCELVPPNRDGRSWTLDVIVSDGA